jgi:Icc protein
MTEIDRRGFLKCMAWTGTAVVWTVSGGVLSACEIGGPSAPKTKDLSFVQISDTHIGFKGPANQDVTGTFQLAIDRINALKERPSFVMHTGDLSHLSTVPQFDTVKQMLGSLRTGKTFQVPGEHDQLAGNEGDYLALFGEGSIGRGWYSFDVNGVHFLALVNASGTEAMGHLGPDQLDWVRKDVAGLSSDTPIVVFAHVPLFAMYPAWGWSTDDAVQALSYMKRFGSVSVLNGHVHQVMTKVEGNVTFHTARATAYPQPKPGAAPNPGPLTVPSDLLHQAVGIMEAKWTATNSHLAVVDRTLT